MDNKYLLIILLIQSLVWAKQELDFSINITKNLENYMGQKLNFEVHNGYVPVTKQENESLFYTLITKVEETLSTTQKNTPVMFWLDGGPGCTGQFEIFNQLGPFKVKINLQQKKLDLTLREISWNQQALLVVMDQPLGTGWSYGKQTIVSSTEQAKQQFKIFIQKFYQRYPDLIPNPTYIFGYSYAGHFVPSFANMIQQENPVEGLKFEGISIGDGWIDALKQSQNMDQYGYNIGFMGSQRQQKMQEMIQKINQLMDENNVNQASKEIDDLSELSTPIDKYNIHYYYRLGELDPKIDPITMVFLFRNKQFRKNIWGIPDFIPEFEQCSSEVYDNFTGDSVVSYQNELKSILDSGVKVLLYNGQLDFMVTSPGQQDFINTLQWKYSQNWYNQEKRIWYQPGSAKKVFSNYQQYSNFAYVNVYQAGHVAFSDQPEAGRDILERYMEWNW